MPAKLPSIEILKLMHIMRSVYVTDVNRSRTDDNLNFKDITDIDIDMSRRCQYGQNYC